jgi:hypothetical protein
VTAIDTWKGASRSRLAELERVHAHLTGPARGRQWGTAQLNRSLFIALCAQFQRYSRQLHDDAVAVHVSMVSVAHQRLLRQLLTQDRVLDRGNPRRSALGSDFGRLGFNFVASLHQEGRATSRRLERLDILLDYRNANGHGDDNKVTTIETSGEIAATKASYVRYRRALDCLAATMSVVVSRELQAMLGIGPPW